jgi:hypothetical protein
VCQYLPSIDENYSSVDENQSLDRMAVKNVYRDECLLHKDNWQSRTFSAAPHPALRATFSP